jgi:hypothetical protein
MAGGFRSRKRSQQAFTFALRELSFSVMPVEAHILVTLDEPVREDVLRSLASDLSEALGEDRLLDLGGRGVLFREKEQDYNFLPDRLPRAVCVLRACLLTPYYGPHYERGRWPEIAAALEFLRRRLPTGRVWYGRDDGDWVREVTRESLDELWNHWAAHGGRPYPLGP